MWQRIKYKTVTEKDYYWPGHKSTVSTVLMLFNSKTKQIIWKIQNTENQNKMFGVLPGVGGVEPRELALLDVDRTSLASAPKLLDDEVFEEYNLEFLACVCCNRKFSNFTGEGMKPTSLPSFTSRPIHQLLSYFSCNILHINCYFKLIV